MVNSIAANDASMLTKIPNISIGLHFVPEENQNIEDAITRQIEKFVLIVGIKPSHIDIHKVRQNDIELKESVIKYAHEYGIQAHYSGAAKFINSFYGPLTNADVSVMQLKKSIDEATDKNNELMCHVGYCDDYLLTHSSYNNMRENELRTICSPKIKDYIQKQGISLINWNQINQQ
jgi:predicted glycoside hydrolase/deacetylase ChbG (UPF0249 family)